MKKQYFWLSSLTIFVAALLVLGPHAYADDTSHFNAQIQAVPSVDQLESQFESQLTTRQETYGRPKATSYYDDLVDHYEQDQIMSDFIDKGIR